MEAVLDEEEGGEGDGVPERAVAADKDDETTCPPCFISPISEAFPSDAV